MPVPISAAPMGAMFATERRAGPLRLYGKRCPLARKPRAERTCRVCNSSSVEDEKHVLMECPAYEPLRRAVGFPEDMNMFEVMMTWDQVKLGGLLAQIQKARKELLRE